MMHEARFEDHTFLASLSGWARRLTALLGAGFLSAFFLRLARGSSSESSLSEDSSSLGSGFRLFLLGASACARSMDRDETPPNLAQCRR